MHKRELALTAIITMTALASANDLNNGGNRGVLRTTSAQTLGKAALNVGVGLKYGQDVDFAQGFNRKYVLRHSDTTLLKSEYTNRLISTNIFLGIGAGKTTDISIAIPYYYDLTEWGPQEGGIGDLELAVKVNPFKQNKLFSFAMGVKGIAPTGSKDAGYFTRHAYSLSPTISGRADYAFTGGAFLVEPELFLTGNFRKVKLHLNLGDVINPAKDKQTSTITTAAGIEFYPIERVSIFSELTGETRARWFTSENEFPRINNDQVYVSAGARYQTKGGFFVLGAGDFGLSDNRYTLGSNESYSYEEKAEPQFGGNLQLGWNGQLKPKDTDKDSIPDKLDNCPKQAEDKDGFKDSDGCPDFDNDNDGIVDSLDKSMNEAEDKDGFHDEDGTPDLDNDNDSIPDLTDKCPLVLEDKDTFEDEDGCPDLDNDADGLVDSLDKCTIDPEDKDGFQDEDGCPDLDNDNDGISDLDDKCPNAIGLEDDNGCPVVKEISRDGLVLNGVTFETGKAVLTESSSKTLDEVAASLIAWVEVKVEIQGHTDNTGSAQKNLSMSQERAEAVKRYLYNKGVSADRMIARGYGMTAPVADNKTKVGRAKNRRVELRRID